MDRGLGYTSLPVETTNGVKIYLVTMKDRYEGPKQKGE